MKPTRFRIRTLLIAIALAALIMAGVAMVMRRPVRPYSAVFAGLDPVVLLDSKPGYQVKAGTRPAQVSFTNPLILCDPGVG